MTIDDLRRTRLTRSALSEHDEQLVDVLYQLYRSLADSYHRSATYQRMVTLYPALAAAIEDCSSDWSVPEVQPDLLPRPRISRAAPLLWERSHRDR